MERSMADRENGILEEGIYIWKYAQCKIIVSYLSDHGQNLIIACSIVQAVSLD